MNPMLAMFLRITAVIALAILGLMFLALVFKVVLVAAIVAALVVAGIFGYRLIRRSSGSLRTYR
ncbi:MAG: hypothetical protein ACYDA5_03750 [Vulcanimicrobiaceae bacterium]